MAGIKRTPKLRYLLVALQLAGTVALVSFILTSVNLGQVWDDLRRIDLLTLATCLGLSLLQILILIWRWHIILLCLGASAGVKPLVLGTLSERVVNQLLPSTLGGDAVRIGYAFQATSGLRTAAVSVLLDRLSGIAGLAAICAASGVIAVAIGFKEPTVLNLSLVSGLCTVAALTSVFTPAGWIDRAFLTPPLRRLHPYALAWLTASRRPSFLFATIVLSIVTQALFCIIFMALASVLAPATSLVTLVVLVPFVLIATALPLTVAGWGMRESAAVAIFSFVGMDANVAVAISILFGVVQLIVAILCGIVLSLLLIRDWSLSSEG